MTFKTSEYNKNCIISNDHLKDYRSTSYTLRLAYPVNSG